MKRIFALTAVAASGLLLHTAACPASAEDQYKVRPDQELAKAYQGQQQPHVVTSEHFAIWYGDDNPKKYALDEAYFKEALNYCEYVRNYYVSKMGFPLRNSDGKIKYKTNIMLTETGLKPYPSGWAFGGQDEKGYGSFFGEPAIVTQNHNGAAHEFAHAMQGESGGFRDSEYTGWIWEAHAQFMAHQITTIPDLPHNAEVFIDTAQYEVGSTRHHYGAWIFLQYLAERPDYGVKFINSLWFTPSIDKDEDPISKMIRLAGMKDPAKEWADLYGDFAKRMANFSTFKLGDEYLKSFNRLPERTISRSKAPLEQIKEKPGWYRIPYAFAPQQNAFNVIPLYPQSKRVSVTFKGLVDEARKSDWRVTLVAVDENGKDRFSKTWNAGTQSIVLGPNDKQLFLVVAATPGVFARYPFDADILTEDRFPYEVKIDGALPKGYEPAKAPEGIAGATHPNGGGFVASTAKVSDTAYVGPNAMVLGNAQVLGNARIEDFAIVAGDAVVSGNARLAGHVYVTDKAAISENARVNGYARVYDTVRIDGNARVFEFPRLHRAAHIYGNAVVRGHAIINGADISGTALITAGADPGAGIKCSKGLFDNWISQEECDKAQDHGSLFAYYSFNSPNSILVRDEFGRGDGIIVGNPSWVRGYMGQIEFNGIDQYVQMPSYLCDLRNAEIQLKVRWLGHTKGQRAFDFGRDKDNCMYFSPMSENGKAAFVMVSNGKSVIIEASDPLAVGDQYDVALSFAGDTVTMRFGQEVIGSAKLEASPEDLKADSNYLARGRDGSYFAGQIDSLRIRIKD